MEAFIYLLVIVTTDVKGNKVTRGFKVKDLYTCNKLGARNLLNTTKDRYFVCKAYKAPKND